MKRKMYPEEAIYWHRKEWRMLAKNPKLSKNEALRALGFDPDSISAECFLCEYCIGLSGCSIFCPVKWEHSSNSTTCLSATGLFYCWAHSNTVTKRVKLARLIANLPPKHAPKRRRCTYCGKWKVLKSFDGKKSACKMCLKAKRKAKWSKTYAASEKGKATQKKATEKYVKTEKGKAALERLRMKSKIKVAMKGEGGVE